jgi:hypothetical protein
MVEMLKGTTESGFEYKIPKKRLRNYYLLKSVAKVEKQDFEETETFLNLLFGKEQALSFLKHLEDEDEIVDSEVLFADIKSIFDKSNDLKKS